MRKEKPQGREIADKAKKIKLRADVVEGAKGGKKVKLTPASLDHLKDLDELEDGQVIGVLENEIEGDETGLPSGKHHIFLSKINGEWHVCAESGGEVKAEAAGVKVEFYRLDEKRPKEGGFNPEGWCFSICIIPGFFYCILKVWHCW